MDNITHTLVGAALAEAGLKKRTALGGATLMIAANFPDIDVVALLLSPDQFSYRRGITHGFPALILLPFVLAGIMWLWDKHVRRPDANGKTPVDFRQLVILSAVAMATHPMLDFMNSYGMRWLMPIVDKWFYADGLFIVDPWFMLMLGTGVYFSRRRRMVDPARRALAAAGTYVVCMLCITTMGRMSVFREFGPHRIMVDPAPGVPWKRDVLVEDRDSYRLGTYSAFGRPVLTGVTISKGLNDPAVGAARERLEVQRFLRWSRFPFYRVTRDREGTTVRVADARYAGEDGRSWASVEVRIPVHPSLAGGR